METVVLSMSSWSDCSSPWGWTRSQERSDGFEGRIEGRAGTGNIIVGVCYRDTNRLNPLQTGRGAALHSQALVCMATFNHPHRCWRDNTPGHKKSRRFLNCLSFQEELTKRSAMLDLVLSNKEGLMENVNLPGSLGSQDHEMVEFEILRTVRRVHNKLATLDFWNADFGLFRKLFGRIP